MNAKGIFSILLCTLWILVTASSHSVAQKASAEFISQMPPMKLPTGEQVSDGIQHLFYKDQRLYVANVWAGLQILDVSNMEQPLELGSFRAEERSHNVFVQDNYAYLSNELGGVAILDVTNPGTIVKVGHIETEEDAYWVVADFPTVYVAEEEAGVNIYDISNLSAPRKVANYKTPQWAWGLHLEENLLFIADKTGGMIIVDVANPANPQRLGQFSQMKYTKNLSVENDVAYIANGPSGLSIVDVSNPRFPKLISHVSIEGFIYHAQRSGNSVYLANEVNRRLEIIDVTSLENPVKVAEYVTDGKVYCATKYDVYVFLAADDHTVILRHNNPPVIVSIEDQILDETQTLNLTARGSDPDDDPIFYMIENLPQGAEFDSLTGNLLWTPDYEQSGVYPNIRINVAERTASQLSASAEFTITVNHVNRNPELPDVSDSTIAENQRITFMVPEGSDPDVEDKGRLTYRAENLPEGASFDSQSRMFSWTPNYEQSGVYMVDFVVEDPAGDLMRDGSSITVTHVDRKPVIEAIPDQNVNENEELTFTIEGSDPDQEDQNRLSYEAQNLPEGARFDAATATLTWTPTFDQSGDYPDPLFIFKAGDLSDSVNVGIRVNHINRPPVIADVTDKSIDENSMLRFSISGSDPDVEDDGKLIYTTENLPVGASFDADSLVFSWTPDYEQSGVYEEVRFVVTDPDGLFDSDSITITVNHVNRTPQLAEVAAQTVDENQLLSFSLSGTDPDREDEGKLVYTATGLPEGALLDGQDFSWTPAFDQSGTYDLTFTVSDGRLEDTRSTSITVNHVNREPALAEIQAQTTDENAELTFMVTGSDPDSEDEGLWTLSAEGMPEGAVFDAATGTFSWTPSFDQSGSYTVSFINTDPMGLTAREEVVITVNHVNRTPVFPEQPDQIVDENTLLTYNLVPAEDPDAEDEGKLVYSAADLPEGAEFDAANRVITWTPSYDQSGTYTSELSVTDGEFTVTQPLNITVNHVNRPPVMEAIAAQTIDENQEWTLSVSYSDPDTEDEDKLTLSAENLPEGATFDAATGSFSWTPTYEQSGTYQGVTVTVTDLQGLSDQKTFEIQVNHVNRDPSLEPLTPISGVENSPLEYQLQASDPDQEDQGKLVFSGENLPEGASVDAQSGLLTWTPNFLQAGTYTMTFRVTDTGDLSASQEAGITIEDQNRTPVIDPVPAQTVNENSPLTFSVTATDEDTDNTLTFSAENLPEGAAFDAAGQTFSWTPGYEQAGSYTVTLSVTDGKETVSTDAAITVQNVNRLPEFDAVGNQSVDENSDLSFTVTASDADAGAQLTYSASQLPEGATFDAASGNFTWSPGFEQAGDYTVQFSVDDGEDTVTMPVTITVNNVNRLPVFEPVENKNVAEDNELTFSVAASDEDQGTTLSYSVPDLPQGASFNAQTFSWKPGFDQAGEYEVTFVASDGEDQAELAVKITVENVNRPPEISGPGVQDVRAGEAMNLSYSGSDPDNDNLEFSSPDLPAGAELDSGSGQLSWTPQDDQVGKVSFTVRVSDGSLQAETETTVNIRQRQQTPPTGAQPDTLQTTP